MDENKNTKGESGSAFIIGVLTLWMILYAISLIGRVSDAVSAKMRVQMAADTAALAGARLLADHLSTIAWINDTRATIHYHKMRNGADLISMATLGDLKTRLPILDENNFGPSIPDHSVSDDSTQIGLEGFTQHFLEDFDRLTEERVAPWEDAFPERWDPNIFPDRTRYQIKGQNADEELARFQHALALSARVMIEKEVYDKAAANGSQLTAFFPNSAIFPAAGNERELHIRKIDTEQVMESGNVVERVRGWRLWNDEDGLDVTARSIGELRWDIDYELGGRVVSLIVEDEEPNEDWMRINYTETFGEETEHEQILIDKANNIIFTDSMRLQMEELDDGSTRITRTEDGETTTFRYRYVDGEMQIYNEDTGEFEVPETAQGPDGEAVESIEHNGTQIRLQTFQRVQVGSALIWRDRFSIGAFTIHFRNPVRITSHIYGYGIRVDDDEAVVNGFSTRRANCVWRRAHWHNSDHGSDRSRHRMCVVEPELEWIYEWKRDSSHLQREIAQGPEVQFDRFSQLHGQKEVEGDAREETGFDSILNIRTGEPVLGEDGRPLYNQERVCWHPHDLECPVFHPPGGDRDWCTPEPGKPNGRYHDLESGARVNCHICSASGDRYLDEDGRTTVRASTWNLIDEERLSEPADFDNKNFATGDDEQFIPQIAERLQRMPEILESIKRRPNTASDLTPLVLTEDFFKFGITVGTWTSGEEASGNGQLDLPGADEAFDTDEGLFAFASARAGFRDPDSGEMIYSFDPGALSDERSEWVESEQNLYLADWEATLVPLKTQIQNRDLDVDGQDDSGLSYLLRMISSTAWREDFFSRSRRRNIRIEGLHLNNPEMYDLLQH